MASHKNQKSSFGLGPSKKYLITFAFYCFAKLKSLGSLIGYDALLLV